MIDPSDIADETMEHCESTRYLTLALVGALALLAAVVGLSLIFLL
ncbi:MAG: hypothetical protein AAF514_23460 [Verrucomicrobiota bacterium]